MQLANVYSGRHLLPPDLTIDEALGYEDPRKLPRAGNATHDNDDEWNTPPEIVGPARNELGEIDRSRPSAFQRALSN